ncbi:AzlD domain-containing protein [Symbioplanes lichenis]|uniref:AzlD domain-containing protein n=1 Tax=Symbioplanes lichenis TaxID=1629072 RepID=UPI002739F851|nr:AzlD domain-containing protein [Actinoplanes lichenis]
MSLWIAIAAVAAGSFLIKGIGPAALGERELPKWSTGILALLAPTLLAALVVVEVLGRRWADFDATVLAGLAAAVAAYLLRAPMLLAVVAGVVTTALLRLALG